MHKERVEFHLFCREQPVIGTLMNVVNSNWYLFCKLVFHLVVSSEYFPMLLNKLKHIKVRSLMK